MEANDNGYKDKEKRIKDFHQVKKEAKKQVDALMKMDYKEKEKFFQKEEKIMDNPFYQGKKEKKINKIVTLHPSVIDAVKERLQEVGGKFSALVENLLVSWCYKFDRWEAFESKHEEKIKEMEEDLKK